MIEFKNIFHCRGKRHTLLSTYFPHNAEGGTGYHFFPSKTIFTCPSTNLVYPTSSTPHTVVEQMINDRLKEEGAPFYLDVQPYKDNGPVPFLKYRIVSLKFGDRKGLLGI